MTLAERAARTQTVIDRFRGKPFRWEGANCIRLARAQAVALGHDLPPVPQFRSALGAKKALDKRGFASVSAMLDHYFEQLPAPAFAIVGDLVSLPVDPEHAGAGMDAIAIADGLGNLLCWHAATNFEKLEVVKFAMPDAVKAWRL
ncbi:hypothetical protein K3172_12895 [Qipengyuania sp. 6B39]|uniref:DUF6950 family protein n=1 Tax=Qipengyuania proteolytica TaxID=2867239 RepID=UPI001C8A4CBD|nr:hypothetical protein [Qipengyuania proteolytica]MBX7496756.1 hypothetical protein [Qipengyuania proteolytica]